MTSLETSARKLPEAETSAETPEAPAIEAEPEINNEQLKEHIETAETSIDQHAEPFASDGEKQLNAAAKNIGMSAETFQGMRQQEGLDAELESLNVESTELANDTKREILGVTKRTEGSIEIPANDNEVSDTQNTEISASEKSEEPFVVSDPLLRRISDGTYGRPKKVGKRPKSISEGGTKYVPHSFDSLGWEEENKADESLEPDAEKITAEVVEPQGEVVQESPEKKLDAEAPTARFDEILAESEVVKEVSPIQEPETAPQILEQANQAEALEQKENIEDPKADLREVVRQLEQIRELPVEAEPTVPPKQEAGARWYHGTKVEQQTTLLQERWERKGIETEKIKIPEGGEFSQAIIFKKEAPTEKMVRLYRGVNQMDDSLLDQTPYAMRAQGKYSRAMTVEGMRERVTSLAENPTYDNLMAYVAEAQPHLNRDESRRMQEDITRMEDGILEGYSVRKELIQKQIEHHGGVSENGLTPYTSASFSAEEAAQYGNGGVMVIDVPISQIEDFNENSTEVNIKGSIGKEYITAILLRDRDTQAYNEKIQGNLENALASVSKSASMPLYDQQELTQIRQQKLKEGVVLDMEQWQKDVERVRENRSLRLIRRFKDMNLDYGKMQASSAESGTDAYTGIKNAIYDQYADRLSKLGREGRKPEEFQYEGKDGSTKYFGKDTVDDEMLFRFRDTVERMEEREEQRRRASN